MRSNRASILWLDEYFDEAGELIRPALPQEFDEARSALISLSRRFPNFDILPMQTVGGFVTSLIDYVRCANAMPLGDRWASGNLTAFLVDIMINNVKTFKVPRIDETRRIIFRANGTIDGWNKIDTRDFNVGFAVAKYFIRQIADFDHIPIIFYTNRAINSQLKEELDEINNEFGGCNIAIPKDGGMGELEATLRGIK